MSDSLKVLGQQAPAGTTETILYPVPAATQTTGPDVYVLIERYACIMLFSLRQWHLSKMRFA